MPYNSSLPPKSSHSFIQGILIHFTTATNYANHQKSHMFACHIVSQTTRLHHHPYTSVVVVPVWGVVFASLSRTMHTFCKQIIDKQHQQIQQQTANNFGAVAQHTTHTHTLHASSLCALHAACYTGLQTTELATGNLQHIYLCYACGVSISLAGRSVWHHRVVLQQSRVSGLLGRWSSTQFQLVRRTVRVV